MRKPVTSVKKEVSSPNSSHSKNSVYTARSDVVKEERSEPENGMQMVENGERTKAKQEEPTIGNCYILVIVLIPLYFQ